MAATRKHRFIAQYSGDRPQSGPAKRAEIVISKPDGTVVSLRLNPGELRALAKAALIGLGYTKVGREYGQWDQTWEEQILQKIEPILVVTKALLPTDASPKGTVPGYLATAD